MNFHTPTIARAVPAKNVWRWPSFSATNSPRRKESLPTQTQHPNALPASWHCPGQRKGVVSRGLFHLSPPSSLSVKPGWAAGATNAFHFVITTDKPFTTTNLTAKFSFSRVVLVGGKLADPVKDVQIQRPEDGH
jgi:hypothetical protein